MRMLLIGNTPQALGATASPTFAGITVTGAAVFSSTVSVTGDLTLADAANVVLGSTTGTKFGTATTQKLAFYNATPVVQPAGTTDVLASLVTLGLRAASSNPPLNLGTGALTCGAITASGNVDLDSDTALLRLGTNQDVILAWDAANVLAQRNGTAAQIFRVYNTFTSATNYEVVNLGFSANDCYLTTNKGSGGGTSRNLYVGTDGAGILYLRTGGAQTQAWAVSSGHLIAVTDNTVDIGASGGTRPRSLFLGSNITIGGVLDHDGTTVGFYGVTPTARPAAYTQTYATATRTHADFTSADIGAFAGGVVGFLDAAERDNIRTQFNALRADVANLKQLVNQMIDDRQLDGLAQ